MKYTTERNNQIMIELLKKYNIKKIIASPGATNVSFIASVQSDPFFEIYSCVDERSAAYMACGMSEESGEPVVISCTGATASRNYFPGLTEAYYRKLPILAITSTMPIKRIGHNIPQVIDRTNVTNDIAKLSVQIPMINEPEDEWYCMLKINEAINELWHNGNGPVHINLETKQSGTFSVEEIKDVKVIKRICNGDKLPEIKEQKIAIFIGAHSKMSPELVNSIDEFCEKYNAVVITDHTGNYVGKYKLNPTIMYSQKFSEYNCTNIDLLIHIGNISGAYYEIKAKNVWRVNLDGKYVDTYRNLKYVFQIGEKEFFEKYNERKDTNSNLSYYKTWKEEIEKLKSDEEKMKFSNIYIASKISKKLPQNCVLHLGILNSLRSWNFFDIDETIAVYCNTGGFGIDGNISSVVGAALANPEKIFFAVVGDLSFFYDMNIIGNRHFPSNVRIIVINNGKGQEFSNYGHRAAQFGEKTGEYIGAAGHFGNKSENLVKDYVENLGVKYLTANSKESLKNVIDLFTDNKIGEHPVVLECFTDTKDETDTLKYMCTLDIKKDKIIKKALKKTVKKIIKK